MQLIKQAFHYFTVAMTTILFTMPAHAEHPESQLLTCELALNDGTSQTTEVHVRYSITNNSNQALLVLPWHTPLEGFLSNLFVITDHKGNELGYQGAMVKRMAPIVDDYLLLEAKSQLSHVLSLSDGYSLIAGSYHLALRNENIVVITDNKEHRVHCAVPSPIKIKVN